MLLISSPLAAFGLPSSLLPYLVVLRRTGGGVGAALVVQVAVALEAVRPHLAAPRLADGVDEAPEGPHAAGHDPLSLLDVGQADLGQITPSRSRKLKIRH